MNVTHCKHLQVAHITADHSELSGGVARVVDQLARRTSPYLLKTEIVCIRPDPMPASADVTVILSPPGKGFASWGWSRGLYKHLQALASDGSNQIFHIHGVWLAPHYLAAVLAHKNGVKSVFTSHAMLLPWFWNNQGIKGQLKKYLYWSALAKRAFNHSTVVHAITEDEGNFLRCMFPKNRIEVIPNAIDLDSIDDKREVVSPEVEPIIVFLGRIHPQKGIDILIHSFSRANLSTKWKLIIAGPPEKTSYYDEIRRLVAKENLTNRVEFVGPVIGKEKISLLSRAWVVVVPSHIEVIGLVNLESAACFTPTITTHATGLSDWSDNGGVLINADIEELVLALKDACNWSPAERHDRGRAMRRLIEKRYCWDVVLGKWLALYASL